MAPGYRANAQSRRNNRTNVDHHDVLEGIPVRHWRRDYVTVAPQAAQENTTTQNDIWAVELPHGMPKDFHLLPQHSQDLLRAARSGKIYKRPAPVEEEEVDPELVGEKSDKKEDDPRDKGFTARAWKQIPRNQEGPSVDYLAKRRKGIIAVGTKAAPVKEVHTVTKATVRRTDAAGNTYVQDMVVANGEKVEGEVIAQTLIPDPNSASAVAELQSSPMKRKPIKRKMKGPGRGRKKKMLPPTSAPTSLQGDGLALTVEEASGGVDQDGIKIESDNGSVSAVNEDTEMGDDSNMASDDDDGEDGEDGDDDEEGTPETQNSPVKSQQNVSPIPDNPQSIEAVPALLPDVDMTGADLDPVRPPSLERLKTESSKSGSPLKNIALTTSNLNSPIVSPTAATKETVLPANTEPEIAMNEVLEEPSIVPTDLEALTPPPPDLTEAYEAAAVTTLEGEKDEAEMLLNANEIVNDALVKADIVSESEIAPGEDVVPETVTSAPVPAIPTEAIPTVQELPSVVTEEKMKMDAEPPAPADEPVKELPTDDAKAREDKDEDFTDLLGNLERQLDG